MQQVGDRFGVSNSVDDSYKTAIDQMQANPDLKGFLIFGANGPIGAGNAVSDRDKIGKVIVVGPFIPSQGQKLMKAGAITRGFLWNPIDSGYAMVALGKTLATGGEIKDGMDLPGMGPCQVDASTPRDPRQQADRSQPAVDRRVGEDHLSSRAPGWLPACVAGSALQSGSTGLGCNARKQLHPGSESESADLRWRPQPHFRSASLACEHQQAVRRDRGARRHRLVGRAAARCIAWSARTARASRR